jgi:hypothetical protein
MEAVKKGHSNEADIWIPLGIFQDGCQGELDFSCIYLR